MNKIFITAAITGAGTMKSAAPTVPYHADEIAAEVVACAKAGAAIAHIHVRDDKGAGTMSTEKFREAFYATKKAIKEAAVDVIINLTTSGGKAPTEIRLAHLKELKPEMCSFDAGSMNWGNRTVFENSPEFLEQLGTCTSMLGIKPEIEIFDAGMMGNAQHYINKGFLKKPCHYQFVMDVPGGLDGTVRNLEFLHSMLPSDCTWSVTGIGKTHLPMLLTGLALGANGIRVGLEDNIMLSKGVVATNVQLVERAVRIAKEAGRTIASAEETRRILGII